MHTSGEDKDLENGPLIKDLNFRKAQLSEFAKFAGILSAALSQHDLSGFEIAQLEFHHLH